MSTFVSSIASGEPPTPSRPESYPGNSQTLDRSAQLRTTAHSLQAKSKLLRLEHLKVMLDLALNVATFPGAEASDPLVSKFINTALKVYNSVRSIAEVDNWTRMDKQALETQLERLRAVL